MLWNKHLRRKLDPDSRKCAPPPAGPPKPRRPACSIGRKKPRTPAHGPEQSLGAVSGTKLSRVAPPPRENLRGGLHMLWNKHLRRKLDPESRKCAPTRGPTKTAVSRRLDRAKKAADPCTWAGTVTWMRFRHETIKSSAPPAREFARGVAHALEQALAPQVGSGFEEMRTPPAGPPKPRRPGGSIGRKKPRTPAHGPEQSLGAVSGTRLSRVAPPPRENLRGGLHML